MGFYAITQKNWIVPKRKLTGAQRHSYSISKIPFPDFKQLSWLNAYNSFELDSVGKVCWICEHTLRRIEHGFGQNGWAFSSELFLKRCCINGKLTRQNQYKKSPESNKVR